MWLIRLIMFPKLGFRLRRHEGKKKEEKVEIGLSRFGRRKEGT